MKYHVRNDGTIGECTADVQGCPLKGATHFTSLKEAEGHATLVLENEFGIVESLKKESGVVVNAPFCPMAGGHYFGCRVNKADVEPFLNEMRSIVGADKAAAMERDKAGRDRGFVYHTTVIRPQEAKLVKGLEKFPESFDMEFVGIGRAESDDGEHEAWFLVVDSPDAQAWRATVGLPPHDLHVTLAFLGKDVHNKPKGRDSLIDMPKNT